MTLIELLDFYSYLNGSDDLTLMLNDYNLDNRLNKNILNMTILSELGAMRPRVNDSKLFKELLENFFNKYSFNITRLVDTMYYDYNPLTNVDYTTTKDEDVNVVENTDSLQNISRGLNESSERDIVESNHRTSDATVVNTDSNTKTDNTTTTTDETLEHLKSAYDEVTYSPDFKEIKNNQVRNTGTTSTQGTGTSDIDSETTSDNRTDDDLTRQTNENSRKTDNVDKTTDTDRLETDRVFGKMGETTYQKLIEQERKLAEFNIYNWIIKQMRGELFLLVY